MAESSASSFHEIAAPKSRIFVVEDNAFTRESVVHLINKQHDLVTCGEADSIATARLGVVAQMPDLMLLDLRLKDGQAFELINSIKLLIPQLPILVFSIFDEMTYGQMAFQAGARGYVSKQYAADDLLGAIRALLVGRIYFNRTVDENPRCASLPPQV